MSATKHGHCARCGACGPLTKSGLVPTHDRAAAGSDDRYGGSFLEDERCPGSLRTPKRRQKIAARRGSI